MKRPQRDKVTKKDSFIPNSSTRHSGNNYCIYVNILCIFSSFLKFTFTEKNQPSWTRLVHWEWSSQIKGEHQATSIRVRVKMGGCSPKARHVQNDVIASGYHLWIKFSLDWLKGNSTVNHGFPREIQGFPINCPSNQSREIHHFLQTPYQRTRRHESPCSAFNGRPKHHVRPKYRGISPEFLLKKLKKEQIQPSTPPTIMLPEAPNQARIVDDFLVSYCSPKIQRSFQEPKFA